MIEGGEKMSKIYRLEDFEKIYGKEKTVEFFDAIFSEEFDDDDEEEKEMKK